MRMNRISVIRCWGALYVAFVAFVSSAHTASAAFGYDRLRAQYGFEDPLGGVTVPELIGRIIAQALPLVGSLFLLMFIWSGVQWMTAGGDKNKVAHATQTIRNSVIGIAIVLGAYMIVSVLLDFGSTAMNAGMVTPTR